MKHLFKRVTLALIFLVTSQALFSQVITPFAIKKQLTQRGGIVFLSNSAIHCSANPPASTGSCKTGADEVPPSGSFDDNDFNGAYVDIDGDASTVMSSSDSLNLPSCSQISWAGLFWGASRTTTLTASGFQTIKIKANNGAYTSITAGNTQVNTTGFNTYHCFADITTFMQAAGTKVRLTVADIKTDVIGNSNIFGSWTLVVMYKNDLYGMRQLTCFEGLANVSGSATVNIPISGFLTPTSGPVTFETGIFVHDGDRGSTGDQLKFNGGSGFVNISDALNPTTNIMNSTVSNNGVLTPYRKPSLNNTGGLDADIFVPNNTSKNYMGNSVTSATFQVNTTSETYLPQMITTAIDVYEPDLRASIKARDVNGGTANPGDIIEYTVKGVNIGSDPSIQTLMLDTIERNGTYIPNSIKITYGPNAGAKTDASGDDQVEYDAANRLIRVRIGTGANATTGGTVNNSSTGTDSTIFTYSITITNSCTKIACDNVIDAQAYIQGRGNISTNLWTNASNPGIYDAQGCPIPGTTKTTITAPSCTSPTASVSPSSLCAGGTFSLTGNSDQEVTYAWSGPNSYTTTTQNPVISNATTAMSGTYTYSINAYTGCVRTATTTVTVSAIPTLTATSSPTAICSSSTATLTASGASTYTWNPGGATTATTAVTPTATTVYTVTGRNAASCANTQTVSLSVTTTPTVGASASPASICTGGSTTLTATGATSYTWNPGAITGASVAVSPTTTTTYTVTGANGSCTGTRTVTVTFNAVPTVTASATPTAICAGSTATLTAGGASTYTWNPGAATGASVTVSPTGTTIYTVTGASAAGCVNTRTVSLTVNALPTLTVSANPGAICSSASSTLSASGANTYTWNPGPVTGATVSVSPSATTVYTVSGTNASSCVGTNTVNVSVTATPTINASVSPSAICSGSTGTLSATGATSYTWNPGALTGASVTINPSSATVYTVTGANGSCVSTRTVNVPMNTCPSAVNDGTTTIQGTPVSANAGTNDGSASGGTFTADQPTAGTGTVSINSATGQYTYTPAAGFTGTTTATYTLCNGSPVVCSSAAINFTVFPTLTANPDVIATTPSVTTSGTLTANDAGIVSGATYSVSVTQPSSTTGTITVNAATGNYTFTPNPAFTGSTTTTYTVCNTSVNPTSCSSTTITLKVASFPVAVADATTTIVNTAVSGNLGTNDTGAGASSSPAFTASSISNGTLTVNSSTGQYTFTPTTGFTGTTSATYTLCNMSSPPCSTTSITFTVYPAVTANPDVVNTTPGTATSGTLITNDSGIVAGATYSVSVTQPSSTTGTITVNAATGQYTFTPNPAYTGSTTTTYTVCNTSVNPTSCSNTTITLNVFPNPAPVNDGITTMQNTTVSGNAATNDAGTTGGTFSAGQPTAGTGTLTMNGSTGQYTFTPTAGFTGTTTATYTLCNGAPVTCATAVINFTVYPTLVANPDVVNTTPGTATNGTLTTNDNGVVAGGTYSVSVTQPSSTTGTITVNAATGNYTFTPNPAYTGSTTTTYTICNTSVNPTSCSTTTITLNVFPNPAPINDANTTIQGTPVSGNAASNDGGTTGGTFSTGQPTAGTGTITMNGSTGQYTYTPTAGFTGTTSATYTLCNGAPVTCATAVITLTVYPTLVANPDAIATSPGTSTSGTLTSNDGGIVAGGTYSTSVTQPSTSTGTITINAATGGYTFTPNPAFTGSTTASYTVCNRSVNPVVCSSTTISIVVGNQPVAVADGTTTIINTLVSGNAGTNDAGATVPNSPVFTASPVTAGTGTLTMNASTGQYTFTPSTGFTGTTTATYTLCNLSSPPCSTTSITFTVFPALTANPDVVNTTPGTATSGSLPGNDNGVVTGATYSVSVTQPSSTTGTITINPATGNYTFTPNPAYTGSTTTTYTICNTSVNPTSCSSTTITLNVFPNPAPVNDGITTIQNTAVSGNAGTNDAGTTFGTFSTGQPTAGTGTLTMNGSTGQYTFTPAAGFTGTTTATYTLCNGAPVTCATAVINFTVFPTLTANPDGITTTPGTAANGNLTTNDNGIVAGATYSVSVTQPSTTTGTITINPATGQYTFTPNPAYTGSTTTTYTVCNTAVNPIVCSTTSITIIVGNQPVAVADGTTTIVNTAVSGNLGTNDTGSSSANGPVFTAGAVSNGTLTVNSSTGSYTFTPTAGFTGTTSATYTLCNLSSPPCSTTSITFTVYPAVTANPDVVNTTPGTATSGTLITNDGGIVAGATYSVSVTQPSTTTGTITINPATGQYTFTPNPAYTGSTTTTYTVCNTSVNPTSCSSTTITLNVFPNPAPVNDGITTIQNTAVSGNAGTNDAGTTFGTFSTGQPTAGTGTLTMNAATGQFTFTPTAGFTGTTTATYTLCNGAPVTCATAVINFTVFPTLVANPDAVSTTPGTATSGTLTTNDNGVVAGGTYSVSVTQPSSTTGTITVNAATGNYTFTPNPAYTGSTTTTYTICNTAVNPIVCSTTSITIVVGNQPVAVADGTTTIAGTAVSGNLGTNDTGSSAANGPVFTASSVSNGTLTVNSSTGSYTFTPTAGFTGTTSATYTLCNLSSPPCSTTSITFTVYPEVVANPDVANTTPGTATSGTLTSNDGGIVPGATYSVSVTPPAPGTGTITIDPATGNYTFTPNPTYTGSTTTTYTVCNTSVNPSSCSSSTITLNVFPNPAPVNDGITTIENTPVSGNAGTNDGGTTFGTFSTGQPTAGTGTITMNPATGQYTFTPTAGFTGTTTATYTLCNGAPVTCATAVITVTVFPTLVANPDAINTTPGTTTSGTLTTNDNGVVTGGTYSVSVTQPSSTTGTITINPATGNYTFTPNPAYTGSTTTTYTICNTAVNPIVCSTTTIAIVVGNQPVAVADGTTTIENTPVSGNLGSNDSGVTPANGPVFTASPVSNGTLTVNSSTGSYTFTPTAGFTGTTTATYTLCNLSSPPCSTTSITFTVFPTLIAHNDTLLTTPTAPVTGNLTGNDDGVVPGATYSVSVTPPAPGTGTITIDPATGSYTFTPDPTYTGTTSTTYTVCNTAVNPSSCSTATINITVSDLPVAVADSATTMENTPVSGTVATNDVGAAPANSPVFTASPVNGGNGTFTMDPATGSYTFTPNAGFTGTTSATYTVCNLSSPPCSSTTITFTVFPILVANNDTLQTTPTTPINGTLTGNDGGIVPGATYSVTVTPPAPGTGTLTVDPATGSYTFTPDPTYTGTTTTTYTVCNTSVNPSYCSSDTLVFIIGDFPVAVADSATTLENTPVTGNVSGNDTGALPVNNPVFTAGPVNGGNGTWTMDPATGNYTFTPTAGFTGTTTATYTVCNLSSPPCSSTTITFTVYPTLVANNDTLITTPTLPSTGTLTGNDGGVVPGGTYSVTVTPPAPGTGTITVDPATGSYTFTPDPGYTGTTATTYTVCNNSVNPVSCSTATIVITVGDFPVAVADSATTMENTPVSGNAATNDVGAQPANSPVFTAGPVNGGNGTLTMDPSTGSYTFTPTAGFTGTTTATYTVCNISSPPCSSTTITFTVFPTLVANADTVITTPNTPTSGSLTGNDNGVVPGGTYSVTVTPPAPGTGTITVDPATGSYTFTPDPAYTGTTTTTYTVCNQSVNPTYCSSDTITFYVGMPQVAVAKEVLSTVKTNATTYQSVFSFHMTNLGNMVGQNVQLVDNLNNTFPAPMTYTVLGVSANAPLTANLAYDGNTNTALLGGSDALNPAANAVVTMTVNFNPNGSTLTSLSNSAIGSTSSVPDPTGNGPHTSVDTTNSGNTPDPNGNGNPNDPGENTPTTFGQQIAAAKVASSLTGDIATSTYQTVFTFNVASVGPVTATNVQLVDDLNNAFPAPMTYTVVGVSANTPLTANSGYNGSTNIALLSGNDNLPSGSSALVTLTVNFSTNGSLLSSLSNSGIASTSGNPDPTGTGPHTSIDTTGNGTNPDPNDNGVPGEPGENTPTTFGQQIGGAKTAAAFTKVDANTFQTVFTFNVGNYGAIPATNVQLTDNLNATFPAPMSYTVVGLSANAPLTANAGYNGNTNIALLSGSDVLGVAQHAAVTLTVNFNPNNANMSTLSNVGLVSTSNTPDPTGNGPHTSVDSTNTGTDPDPNENGNPTEPGENNPTFFGEQVGAAKTASALTRLDSLTYQTVFTFNVTNTGPVKANNIQLTDNLNNALPAPITYTVAGLSANTPLTTNAGFNGNTNIALLSGSNSLNPGQNAIVTLTVNFTMNSSTAVSLSNIGIVSTSALPDPTGNGPHTSVDTTNTGTNPDPDGDGNPNEPDENNPTFFGQQIGIAKAALESTYLGNGVSQTAFVFTVHNYGVLPATNVQITDDLDAAFPAPITYTVSSLTAGTALTTNGSYNGNSVQTMLSGSNTLAVGATETVTLVVNYTMNNSTLTSLYNSAIATTTGTEGTTSTDTTTSGNNPDPDGDGNPNGPGENDPTVFTPAPAPGGTDNGLNIPQGFSPNGDGVNDVFVIRGISEYPNNTFTVLNRWGNVVFKMDHYDNSWNGKTTEGLRYGGDDLPEGTYFYILDLGNGEKPLKGYIYLNKTVK